MQFDNYDIHENHRIPCANQKNYENIRIAFENHENHENRTVL